MTLTTTGVGFLLSSLGLTFCGVRFFRAFQNIGSPGTKSQIGILLSTFFLGTALQHAVLAVAGLFFTGSSEALFVLLVISIFILTLVTALGVYLLLYILFPFVSPWQWVTSTLLFGATIVFFTIAAHPLPFIDSGLGIEWNMPHLLAVILSYLIFLNIGIPIPIFINAYLLAKSRGVKIISMVIVLLSFLGIINVFIRFLLLENVNTDLRTRIFDVILTIIGLVFIVAFLLPPRTIVRIFKSSMIRSKLFLIHKKDHKGIDHQYWRQESTSKVGL